MTNSAPCPICQTPCTVRGVDGRHAAKYECDVCGKFTASGQFTMSKGFELLSDLDRVKIAGVIRNAEDDGRAPPDLDYPSVKAIVDGTHLPDALEQADAMIDYIRRHTRTGGSTAKENIRKWTARLFLDKPDAFNELSSSLAAQGLIDRKSDGPVTMGFQLTFKGWERARELRKVKGSGNQAFVAMWFSDELNEIYDRGIKPALEATGYAPYRVDREHHNSRIDSEIMAQIRKSKLVIADATGARPSVYYEAGLADGLGIPVLWCCTRDWEGFHVASPARVPVEAKPPTSARKKWFDVLAFDTNHLVHTPWTDADDLCQQLTSRIRGLGYALNVSE